MVDVADVKMDVEGEDTRTPVDSAINTTWWRVQGEGEGLKMYNSLTHTKDEFVPKNGRHVKWYTCGPTVYNVSHLGHARTYLSFDIVRRIMTDYFRYDVEMVMNITDLDDKIIIRSNELGVPFTDITKKYEGEFWNDMDALGVRRPDVLTRVTEYMPEIVAFVKRIVDNGLAYVSNGSVYFDTEEFKKREHMRYGKLEPTSVGNAEKADEGEGSLSVNAGKSDKKNNSDFALWKKSKQNEPEWEANHEGWSSGRPGWHIECSAMASEILGQELDVHSGGEDLKFPHHDNELAQSEAYFGCKQWVNYFLHAGHLNINGLKMSKSLKNFITIQEALETYSARQIRFLFLLHKYDGTMLYSKETMDEAVGVEKLYKEFFLNLKAKLRELESNGMECKQNWADKDMELRERITLSYKVVDEFLRDNFNWSAVMAELQNLMKAVSVYSEKPEARALLMRAAGNHITEILRVFGIVDNKDFGLPVGGGAVNAEAVLTPYLDAIAKFRDEVRDIASKSKDKDLLNLCDAFRNDVLPQLGVRLEDRANAPSVWKLEDKETLLKEKMQKLELEQAKTKAKAAQEAEKQKKLAEKAARAKIPPSELFKNNKDYSKFDNEGLPTHNAAGEELTKSASKKLRKEFDAQVKVHKAYLTGEGASK